MLEAGLDLSLSTSAHGIHYTPEASLDPSPATFTRGIHDRSQPQSVTGDLRTPRAALAPHWKLTSIPLPVTSARDLFALVCSWDSLSYGLCFLYGTYLKKSYGKHILCTKAFRAHSVQTN
jgi:hypothetical protein|uniref:Uncharacterized protein n=1 Tax=Oryza sativa subsp. japonica TaxID=39947 RepID=Q6ZFS2_ORYSJ|nr:hypothetical protein [Oryza sativa Japonica Group]